jgi:hypothetical protein
MKSGALVARPGKRAHRPVHRIDDDAGRCVSQDSPPSRCDGPSAPAFATAPFRATGITEYLRNGQLEMAQQIRNHESVRTTGLYDPRHDM